MGTRICLESVSRFYSCLDHGGKRKHLAYELLTNIVINEQISVFPGADEGPTSRI